jgi:hypothetical protein
MTVLCIKFNDFKRLAENRRVYIYEGDIFFDFHYLVDGMLVKTTVAKASITNPTAFFSDKLFYGYVKIDFRIPTEHDSILEFVPLKIDNPTPETPIVQTEEVKNTDIQKEGSNGQ